jgi:hypothetical protein
MKKSKAPDFDREDRKIRKIEKGTKVDKYKKRIYNMASSLNNNDEDALDELLDYEDVQYKRFKLR